MRVNGTSGGHEGHDRTPRAVVRGTADGMDAGGIRRARNRVGDEDVSRVGENTHIKQGAVAGVILQLIRLRIGHRL